MTETEFLTRADAVLRAIESKLERLTDAGEVDIECSRSGNVLEIEFVDSGAKVIVNTQAAMQEIWLAARTGGFHFRFHPAEPAQAAGPDGLGDGEWRNTRDDTAFFASLAHALTAQAGVPVTLD